MGGPDKVESQTFSPPVWKPGRHSSKAVASQCQRHGFDPGYWCSVWALHCGCVGFLPHSKDEQIRWLIGCCKILNCPSCVV